MPAWMQRVVPVIEVEPASGDLPEEPARTRTPAGV
jgi:hypothetical protein